MTTSRAALFHGEGQAIEVRELACPAPHGAEIVVRVLGCTLCGSDLHSVSGRRSVAVPTVLGHEIAGVIEAFGEAASRADLAGQSLQIGDRVTWSIGASCGECFMCQRGLPQKCASLVKYGHEPLTPGRELLGGLAEHCLLVPGTAIVRLPDQLPLEVACPANCATATIAAALEAAGELQNRNVCVFGAGMLGLTATAMSRAAGANVTCVDVNEARLRRATDFGATARSTPDDLAATTADATQGHGFDVVLEVAGAPTAFESALDVLRIGGTIVLVGAVFPGPAVPVAIEQLVRRNVSIHGIHNYAPRHLLAAVNFLAEHHESFPFAGLVDRWFPLDDVSAAFEAGHDPSRIRVGVRAD